MKFYSYKEKKNICGTQIREYRKKLGITQAELGARVQVYGVMLDQKAVSRIELLDRINRRRNYAAISPRSENIL